MCNMCVSGSTACPSISRSLSVSSKDNRRMHCSESRSSAHHKQLDQDSRCGNVAFFSCVSFPPSFHHFCDSVLSCPTKTSAFKSIMYTLFLSIFYHQLLYLYYTHGHMGTQTQRGARAHPSLPFFDFIKLFQHYATVTHFRLFYSRVHSHLA